MWLRPHPTCPSLFPRFPDLPPYNLDSFCFGGQCVPVSHCGCTRDGRYYRPGEEFWGDDTCRSRCRCDTELGMVVCEDSGCKPGEVCAVVKGVRRCVANSRSICQATGDPHYTTFDGRRYDFMGTCVYLLAGLCSTDPTLTPFAVTVENNHRGSHLVSFTKVSFRVIPCRWVRFQGHCMVFGWVSRPSCGI
uniref:VWFD domain-containing protein n=1 Tax=Zosterops lateralis melanops TaxID=1220523 RepID=A0A8D2P8U0_ZOSLA